MWGSGAGIGVGVKGGEQYATQGQQLSFIKGKLY